MQYKLFRTSGREIELSHLYPYVTFSHKDEFGHYIYLVSVATIMDLDDLCKKYKCNLIYDSNNESIELIDDYRE